MEPEQINSTPEITPETNPPQKRHAILVYVLFVAIILCIASWVGLYIKKKNIEKVNTMTSVPVVDETETWKTYRNEEYGFEFQYPYIYKLTFKDSLQMPTHQIWHISLVGNDTIWNISGLDGPYSNESCPTVDYNLTYPEETFAAELKQDVLICKFVYPDNNLVYAFYIHTNDKEVPLIEVDVVSASTTTSISSGEIKKILSTFKFINKPFSVADYLKPFQKGELDYYGTVTLTGYLITKEEQFQDADMLNYANFYFTKTDNNAVVDYLAASKNNFYGGDYIGLGCYDKSKGSIDSINSGDFDSVSNKISGEDLKYLLLSSKTNQIKLQASKSYVSDGKGASACYSHFRDFKIIK